MNKYSGVMAEDRGDGTLECPVNDGLISSGPDPLLLTVSQLGPGAGLVCF